MNLLCTHVSCRASLDKLVIRGIRSFDDKSSSIIEFDSPVTVIVGANGTGKTVTWLLFIRHIGSNVILFPLQRRIVL